jgi:hypothetical protein
MPRSASFVSTAACRKNGGTSIWSTAGTTRYLGEQAIEVIGQEVADADRAHLSLR